MWRFDLLAIKLIHSMQASFPITLACHWLEEEEDQSLRNSNDYHISSFEEQIFMNKRLYLCIIVDQWCYPLFLKTFEKAMSYNMKQ